MRKVSGGVVYLLLRFLFSPFLFCQPVCCVVAARAKVKAPLLEWMMMGSFLWRKFQAGTMQRGRRANDLHAEKHEVEFLIFSTNRRGNSNFFYLTSSCVRCDCLVSFDVFFADCATQPQGLIWKWKPFFLFELNVGLQQWRTRVNEHENMIPPERSKPIQTV